MMSSLLDIISGAVVGSRAGRHALLDDVGLHAAPVRGGMPDLLERTDEGLTSAGAAPPTDARARPGEHGHDHREECRDRENTPKPSHATSLIPHLRLTRDRRVVSR